MKTSPAKDADTLRFTLCDDQDMGDMEADPWCSAETDHEASLCRTIWTIQVECGIRNGHCAEINQWNRMNQKSHVLCLLEPVHSAIGTREILYYGTGYRTLQS